MTHQFNKNSIHYNKTFFESGQIRKQHSFHYKNFIVEFKSRKKFIEGLLATSMRKSYNVFQDTWKLKRSEKQNVTIRQKFGSIIMKYNKKLHNFSSSMVQLLSSPCSIVFSLNHERFLQFQLLSVDYLLFKRKILFTVKNQQQLQEDNSY